MPEIHHGVVVAEPEVVSRKPFPRAQGRDFFYLSLTLAMTATAFFGFWFTYFAPMFDGAYPEVSPLVHVHGWTFFAWYLLLPAQAGLIRSGRVSTHRAVGLGSIALGVVMIVVGLIVSAVQVDLARRPDGNPFWALMGVPIFAIWMLFTTFYVSAIYLRKRRTRHKQFIVLASAVALAAATFRILVVAFGFAPWVAIAGCLAPALFVLAAMGHDHRHGRPVSRVYLWGGSAMVAVIGGAFLLVLTPGFDFVEHSIGWLGETLMPLYLKP